MFIESELCLLLIERKHVYEKSLPLTFRKKLGYTNINLILIP